MTAIPPGSTIGILGSGQLGRMLALAARRMGYGVQVYSPDAQTPAGQIADREWTAPYDDLDQLAQFAASVDVVTLEFENIDVRALEHIASRVPVRPGAQVLHETQNRLREKRMLRRIGIPTAAFAAVNSLEDLQREVAAFSGHGVLKTANWGYDGKGQRMLRSGDDLTSIWQSFAGQEAILEQLVDFTAEVSVIAARNPQGEVRAYAPIHNEHAHHILDVSTSPATCLSPLQRSRAMEIAMTIMRELDVVGLLCVEMFVARSGEILVNELAPRPHNSGHLTINAHRTCQFEQQLRAVCGLPLGDVTQHQPAAMANLLGDVWHEGKTPDWPAALRTPGLSLHLYDKGDPRPGRKMGHLTCLAETPDAAAQQVRAARAGLRR